MVTRPAVSEDWHCSRAVSPGLSITSMNMTRRTLHLAFILSLAPLSVPCGHAGPERISPEYLGALREGALPSRTGSQQGLHPPGPGRGGRAAELADRCRGASPLPHSSKQRTGGGWGQLPHLDSDAYATGQAVYAFCAAAGFDRTSPAVERGLRYLLATQLDDGTWRVRRRAFPFQPTMTSGFPHGRDSWISAAATSWAVMTMSVANDLEGIAFKPLDPPGARGSEP